MDNNHTNLRPGTIIVIEASFIEPRATVMVLGDDRYLVHTGKIQSGKFWTGKLKAHIACQEAVFL